LANLDVAAGNGHERHVHRIVHASERRIVI
jgi:hypothetical protein